MPHVVDERLARPLLDEQLQDREAAATVFPTRARAEGDVNVAGPVRGAGEVCFESRQWTGIRIEAGVAMQRQPGRVAQQASRRYLAIVYTRIGGRQVPARQISLNRRVEVDLSLLRERHHSPRRHRLRDRGDLKDRLARDGCALLAIGKSESARPGQGAILDEGNRDSRHIRLLHEARDDELQ